jgi:hypothetical protein
VSGELTRVRHEWEDAYRNLAEAGRDRLAEDDVRAQVEAITGELRRRIGGTFTLGELADEYAGADEWARATLSELGIPGWARTLTLVEGAAFHLYSRGAVDYGP